MRILVDALTAREGGGITYLRNAIPEMQRQQPEWTYSVIMSPRYQSDDIDLLGQTVDVIPADVKASPPIQRFRFLRSEVPTLIRRDQFDLFFSVAEASTWGLPCPTVVMVRNPNFFSPLTRLEGWQSKLKLLRYKTLWRPIVRRTLQNADRTVFVSESFRRDVARVIKLDQTKSGVVYHGRNPIFAPATDEPAAREIDERPFVLSVSSVARHKDFETLIRAFARVLDEGKDLDLLIAGSTREVALHQALLEQSRKLGVAGRVKFLGALPPSDLPHLYRGAKLFVLPSRLETFGHPLVEAMASGCPVIASSLSVSQEICGTAARFFPVGDDETLATLISELLASPAEREQMIAAGLARAATFSWPLTAESMTHIFREVANARTQHVEAPPGHPD